MKNSQLNHLKLIRLYELDKVLSIISMQKNETKGLAFLEIGAGTGWQAKKIAGKGYRVEAIDIEESNYSEKRIWPIIDYDGKNIPFGDNHFDIIYSSSVLEHITHLNNFQHEMQRVLKPDGIAIHVVPSGNWRFWTSIAHYPYILKTLIFIIFNKIFPIFTKGVTNTMYNGRESHGRKMSTIGLIWKVIFPSRHGETGNSVSEQYYFSKYYWSTIFKESGWEIRGVTPNCLFYTGYMLFGSVIPIHVRRYFSLLFGSVCHIIILVKPPVRN